MVLEDDADVLAEGLEVPVADVHAVDTQVAVGGQVEAEQKAGEGGFAGAGLTDEGGHGAGGEV